HQPAGGQITAPSRLLVTGDENGRRTNIVISATGATSGILPADVEKTIAFGTPHAGRAVFEAGPLATIGTDAIPGTPGEREPRGARRSRHNRPAGGRGRQDL